MPNAQLPAGLISKPEALAKYQKPERTFQRRLSKALRFRNDKFLSHFYLTTSDGAVRHGPDVGEGEVEKLKGEGLYPVWHVEEEWFSKEYDRHNKPAQTNGPSRTTNVTPMSVPGDRSDLDRAALVAQLDSLQQQLEDRKGQISHLRDQISIKDDQIKAANEIARETNAREKESNQLMAELTKVIKLAQQPHLAGGQTDGNHPSAKTDQAAKPADIIEAKSKEGSRRDQPTPNRATPKAKRPSATKNTRKPKPARKPSTKNKASGARRSKSKPAKRQPKWYSTPTLNRLFSRK